MKVLITGAAGMIGRKLAARLAGDAALNGTPIDQMLLVDVVSPEPPAGLAGRIETKAADISNSTDVSGLVAGRPDVIFHLAAIVSGEAELDFDKIGRAHV